MLNSQKERLSVILFPMGEWRDYEIDGLIGNNLKRILFDKDISQNKLAEMIGVDPPLINQIIQQKKGMGKDIMARICNALKVEPYEFFLTSAAPVIQYPIEKTYLNRMRDAENLGVAEEIMSYASYKVSQLRIQGEKSGKDSSVSKKKKTRRPRAA